MRLSVVFSLWLRDMKQYLRNRVRMVTSVTTPLLWLGVVGTGLNSAVADLPGGMSYLSFMAPGILGMTILFTGTFTGISVLWDKQFGFMKEILVAPVSRLEVMVGKVAGGSTTALIQGSIVFLVALLFGVPFPGILEALTVFVLMVLVAFTFVSIGLIIASRLKDPQTFPLAMNFLILPVFFLSGALYPIQTAPTWIKNLSYFNPLAYGVDGLRTVLLPKYVSFFSLGMDLAVLFLFASTIIAVGTYFFRTMEI